MVSSIVADLRTEKLISLILLGPFIVGEGSTQNNRRASKSRYSHFRFNSLRSLRSLTFGGGMGVFWDGQSRAGVTCAGDF